MADTTSAAPIPYKRSNNGKWATFNIRAEHADDAERRLSAAAQTAGAAPNDAEIIALADETRTAEGGAGGYILPISFARAVLAKWGAPQPVAREPLSDEQIFEAARATLPGKAHELIHSTDP